MEGGFCVRREMGAEHEVMTETGTAHVQISRDCELCTFPLKMYTSVLNKSA
jgi:hypothetical protein